MVRRVLEETRKACDKLELHPFNTDEVANLAQSIVISTFRRPAVLVPWSTQELGRLEQLWQTAYKEVWHLMKRTCADIFMFPSHAGGMQYPRPMAILWEATSRNIERALGVTGEHVFEAGQKQPRVQDESVGTTGRRNK
jgi:hypothetical protein